MLSACPKCEQHFFEAIVAEPANSQFKMIFVQCRSCGTVVGTEPFINTHTTLSTIHSKLGELEQAVARIEARLAKLQSR